MTNTSTTQAFAIQPKHFLWDFNEGIATITLNRPER
jgi:enoyl-CoA hydratase/carnithine racemase